MKEKEEEEEIIKDESNVAAVSLSYTVCESQQSRLLPVRGDNLRASLVWSSHLQRLLFIPWTCVPCRHQQIIRAARVTGDKRRSVTEPGWADLEVYDSSIKHEMSSSWFACTGWRSHYSLIPARPALNAFKRKIMSVSRNKELLTRTKSSRLRVYKWFMRNVTNVSSSGKPASL